MRVGIALGSNIEPRAEFLDGAIAFLRALHESGDFLVSTVRETSPQDCPAGSGDFLNAVVELETTLSPEELLHRLREFEEQSGRDRRTERNEPRPIDLDLLYCGQLVRSTTDLTLPHPRMGERLFVLQPLAEIRPHLRLPGIHGTIQERLAALEK